MIISVLVPSYKIIEVPTVQSMLALQSDVYNSGDHLTFLFTNGFNPVLARTTLLHNAVKRECDYILWIDTDHTFGGKNMYGLIDKIREHDLDMLSAGYYCRGSKSFVHGYYKDGLFHKFHSGECKGITDCDILGFGFLVMTKDFAVKMVNTYKKDLFDMHHEDYTTEDVYFCRQAKKLGTRICFDADNMVGHLQTVINR